MDNQQAIITMTKELKTFILNTGDDNKVILIRIIVGLIFLSEGIQRFLFPDLLGTVLFEKIGFSEKLMTTFHLAPLNILKTTGGSFLKKVLP